MDAARPGPVALVALLVALGAPGAGCGACAIRRGTGIFVEIPAEVIEAAGGAPLTLKVRVRALDPAAPPFQPATPGLSPVLNDLTEIRVDLCEDDDCSAMLTDRMGGHGLSISLDPGDTAFEGIAVVVHLTLFANATADVFDAFAALDDLALSTLDCGTIDCAHLPLAALEAVGVASLTLDRLGSSDGDAILFPLVLDGGALRIDPDRDTLPGSAAFLGGACAPALADPDAPWNRRRPGACASIEDPDHFDCEDGLVGVNPFEVEIGVSLGARCYDGLDQNCDGLDGPCGDGDGDGYVVPEDCNDDDPEISPAAVEDAFMLCSDGIDHDCAGGDVACGCDLDGDGYCPTAVGGVPGGDCCEAGTGPGCGGGFDPAAINPEAPELCGDGVDQSCDGVDPPCTSPDADGDGRCASDYDCGVDCSLATSAGRPICCLMRDNVDPALLAACTFLDDCADWDSAVHPGQAELCGDGVDQDCDGDPGTCPPGDGDGDGWPAASECDDGQAMVSPSAAEICGNGVDDDCAGGDAPCDPLVDADGDGYLRCAGPGAIACDCCDATGDFGCGAGLAPAEIHPGAPEACDTVDNDCDGDLNDGNPGGGASPGTADPCYGNPPGMALPFAGATDPDDESWRCRAGRTACTPGGTLICITFVEPASRTATACEEDPLCNARNDLCLTCADGGALPPAERDDDGDGCLAGCGTAPDRDGLLVTAGDFCSGQDCCDTGLEVVCQGQPPGGFHPGALESCADLGADNDCDGDAAESCSAGPAPEMCDGFDQDCDCQTDYADPDAQAQCTGLAEYCDGVGCVPGCDGDPDCASGNVCDLFTNQCVCGAGAPCTGSLSCLGGVCLCGGSACGPGELCVGAGECACGGTIAPSGEACPSSSANPDCNGSSCGCGAVAVCDADETCDLFIDQCNCGASFGGGGPACLDGSPNPICAGGGYGCDADSTCDGDETCAAGECRCGGSGGPTGPACPAGSGAPLCVGGACACDVDSTCGPGEACGVGGDCTCGLASAPSGEACPDGSPNPDCTGAGCGCDADSTCDADETCVAGECWCGATGSATGPACPSSSMDAPACTGLGCACDSDSACGGGEACSAGACTCGSASAPAGEACPDGSFAPECVFSVCMCDSDSICDADETCASGACTCGATAPPAGPACPDGGLTPACDGSGCVCDGDSTCVPPETCVAGACTCGASSQPSGPACAPPAVCDGSACIDTCPTLPCTAGWACATGECVCDDAADCGGLPAECTSSACDCDGGGMGAACGPGQGCVAGACVCLNLTCM